MGFDYIVTFAIHKITLAPVIHTENAKCSKVFQVKHINW